jgi:uncharacterized protein with NRDE domain
MCLILFAVQPNQNLRLAVAANRDEFYGRPASRAHYWEDFPEVLAGRDLQMNGTWLGVSKKGRFAAVTKFRETPPDPIPPRSRGDMTTEFLTTDLTVEDYVSEIQSRSDEYRGFNLVLDDGSNTYYYSNRAPEMIKLEPGFYGLSNQLLDCDWPKVNKGREKLSQLISETDDPKRLHSELFDLLSDKGDDEAFSNSFIATAEYGTCAATVVTITQAGDTRFQEQGFAKHGLREQLKTYRLKV